MGMGTQWMRCWFTTQPRRAPTARETAVRAGKHVLAAMPAASTTAAADELAAAASAGGVALMLGESLRFLPSQQVIKQRLDEGKLGAIGLLRAHRWLPGAGDGAPESAIITAVPYLDLANWLFGTLPTHVYARGRGSAYVQAHLGFPDGGMAVIDVAVELPAGDGYQSVTVIGSTGAAYADDHHNRNLLFQGGDPVALDPGEGHLDAVAELAEMTDAIQQRRAPATTAADGYNALLVAETAQRSQDSGEALQLRGDAYE